MQAPAAVAAAGCKDDETMSVHGFVLPPRVSLEELMRSAAPLGGVKRKAHAEPDRHTNKGAPRPPRLPHRHGVVAGKLTSGLDTSLERGARIIRTFRATNRGNPAWDGTPGASRGRGGRGCRFVAPGHEAGPLAGALSRSGVLPRWLLHFRTLFPLIFVSPTLFQDCHCAYACCLEPVRA